MLGPALAALIVVGSLVKSAPDTEPTPTQTLTAAATSTPSPQPRPPQRSPSTSADPTTPTATGVQHADEATTPCERAVVSWASDPSIEIDDLEDYLPVFKACTVKEFDAANAKFTTEWTRAPSGWIDRRCREYRGDNELGKTKLCTDAANY
jgi:hypothetical protein